MITYQSIKRAQLLFVLLCIFIISSHGINGAIGVTVNSTLDNPAANPTTSPDSTAGVGVVTLRSAIQYVNAFPGWVAHDTIAFNIPGNPPYIIQPGGPASPVQGTRLDFILQDVVIDGYTQPAICSKYCYRWKFQCSIIHCY